MATKVMDISGRIMVPETISLDQVDDGFFEWLESKEWGFAGLLMVRAYLDRARGV